MKYIAGIVTLALIVILPAGSWYYLQSGYDFRLELLQQLEPKGELDISSLHVEAGNLVQEAIDNSTVLVYNSALVDGKKIADIEDQFKNAMTFKTLAIADSAQQVNTVDLKLANGKSSELLQMYKAVLIDTSNQVRQWYKLDSEAQYEEVVEHLAVVLPRVPNKDIIPK